MKIEQEVRQRVEELTKQIEDIRVQMAGRSVSSGRYLNLMDAAARAETLRATLKWVLGDYDE